MATEVKDQYSGVQIKSSPGRGLFPTTAVLRIPEKVNLIFRVAESVVIGLREERGNG